MRAAMALREAELHVRFSGGIETKSDPKAVPATRLLVLENGVFRRAGTIGKRYGYEALAALTGATRTATRDGELLAFSPSTCFSHQPDLDQWSEVGDVYSVGATERPIVTTGTQQTMSDHATLRGVSVVAWEDSAGGVWWSTVDAVTGRVYRQATQADALGRSPRCVPCGPVVHVYYAVPSTTQIMVIVVNPESPSAAVTPVTLVSDVDGMNPLYDAVPTSRVGTPAAIAWRERATTNIRIGYVDASGVLGSPATGHPSILTVVAAATAGSPIGIAYTYVDGGAGDRLVLAYVGAGSSTVQFLSGGSTSTAIASVGTYGGTTTVDCQRIAIVAYVDVTPRAWVAWEDDAVEPSEHFVRVNLIDEVSGGVSSSTIRSVGLASRAFTVDGAPFAVFVHDTTFFNSYFTLRMSDSLCVGRHALASAAGLPTRKHLSSVHLDGAVVRVVLPFRTRLASENGDRFTETGLRRFSLDFALATSHQAAQLGRGLYLAGACPMHYDGSVWTEQGFNVGPELIVATPAGGGSMSPSAVYEYRAWYEWTDAQGEIHRGPTSIGTLVSLGGGDSQVTLTLPTLRLTRKSNVRICVARSRAADTGKTAEMFRVTSADTTTAGDPNGYVANDPTVDSVAFVDRLSDSDLEDEEPLYTDGGYLSNDPSAIGSVIVGGKSRLFATDPGNGLVVRYSQAIADGYGVELPPDLTLSIDPFGGDVTALAIQDDRVMVFKAGAIFTFSGDGPLPNGDTSSSGFSAPQLITSDVGCTDPASIVLTPNGLMFKTAKGIHLLDRSGAVSYVGAPVEAYNGQAVRRATVMPDRTQIVFLTDDGSTLLYDYLFAQWSTFTNHNGYDAVVIDGTYHYLRTDGRLFRETIGEYSDAGTRIRLRLETAWIHMLEQLQGFQRFWDLHLLGTWLSAHQLGIQYQTDYTPSWTDAYWLDATGDSEADGWITGDNAGEIGVDPVTGSSYGDGEYGDGEYGGSAPDSYEWRHSLSEKGHSIQFRFEDFEADGHTGASFELAEMLITGGAKANAQRPFTAARSA